MKDPEEWKDQWILIHHKESAVSGFVVKIQWVHDPILGDNIAEQHQGIADVYIWDPLPKEWKPKHPRALLLDVRDGKWYYVNKIGNHVNLIIKRISR